MKELSDYTTTELLLIAYKVKKNIYNKQIYKKLCEEADKNNYDNCISYAEDLRFKKMIQIYKNKIKLRNQLLENKYQSYRKSKMKGSDKLIQTELFSFIKQSNMSPSNKPLGLTNNSSKSFFLHIKPTNQASIPQMIPHNQIKQSKIFYKKMNEEEKEIDDFLDKLEERNLGKIKNKNQTRTIYSSSDRKRPDTFNFIVEKVTNRKGVKDKNLWPSEFNVILKKLNDDLQIKVEIPDDSQLIQACLAVLMELQKYIFKNVELDRMFFFKKLILSFYDFYRK